MLHIAHIQKLVNGHIQTGFLFEFAYNALLQRLSCSSRPPGRDHALFSLNLCCTRRIFLSSIRMPVTLI